jgi:hypothetical protein
MKKTSIRQFVVATFAALLVMTAVGEGFGQKRKPVLRHRHVAKKVVRKPVVPLYSVASNTILRTRMNQTISSKSARVGDTFTATVTEPVYSTNGVVVIPVGATVTGRVTQVTKAANEGKPGQIDASFVRLQLPNGTSRAINGSLTDVDSGKTRSDNEGGVSGSKMGHRKTIFIGGGAAGGAILGAAIGGGKGALIGGILGAAGGFAGDRFTKGPEAEVKSGTEFGVILNQGISLPRFAEANPVNP